MLACDELTVWRDACVTSWPFDELTGSPWAWVGVDVYKCWVICVSVSVTLGGRIYKLSQMVQLTNVFVAIFNLKTVIPVCLYHTKEIIS